MTIRTGTVAVPFFCGTRNEFDPVLHCNIQKRAYWTVGTDVHVLESRPGQIYIELPNGTKAWVGLSRVHLND